MKYAGIFIILIAASAALYLTSRPDAPPADTSTPVQETRDPKPPQQQDIPASVKKTLPEKVTSTSAAPLPAEELQANRSYGSIPAVKADANPATAATARSLITGEHPERLSTAFKAPAFDPQSFKKDPTAYISESVPGRVYQVLTPGAATPRLKRIGKADIATVQGEAITLKVEAPAGAPVNFVTFDAGTFPNQLTAMSVIADESGVASIEYTPTSGVINTVNIMAGCPMAALNARWKISVSRKDQ